MKKEKRKELRALRDAVENRQQLSAEIARRFFDTDLYKKARILLLYYSVGSEVSTRQLCLRALADNKEVAFPVCVDGDGYMEFFFIKDENDLSQGMYGIKAPREGCRAFTNEGDALIVVPGLGFDKSGNRLGYGKGYYDRFLEGFEGLSIGLCYDALVVDALPCDAYDKKVNCLITDKKIYKFK